MIDQDHEGVIARLIVALTWGAVGIYLAVCTVRQAIAALVVKLKRKPK